MTKMDVVLVQIVSEQNAFLIEQCTMALAPSLRSWLKTFNLPEDQMSQIMLELVEQGYTSSEIVVAEDPHKLMKKPRICNLTSGAKIAFKNQLLALKVWHLLRQTNVLLPIL
jgi:hypothetical protein